MWWPFGKPPSFLGVDIGASGIKVVQLTKKAKRAHLFTFGYSTEALSQAPGPGNLLLLDVEKSAALLKKICEKARVSTKQALAGLPVSAVLTAVINIPKIPPKETEMFIRREAEKLSPLPLQEMTLEWSLVKKPESVGATKEKTREVLLTAASKKTIANYSEIFKKAGLQLISLEAETFALVNALVGKDLTPLIIIDIGASQTDFFLVDSGIPILTHSISFGGQTFTDIIRRAMNVDAAAAEQIKLDLAARPIGGEGGLPKIFENSLSPIIDGINYLFDIFAKQRGLNKLTTGGEEKPEKIILTGGGALLPQLDAHLAKLFSIKVYVGDPWARVIYDEELKPKLDAVGPRFAVALGLALKKIES